MKTPQFFLPVALLLFAFTGCQSQSNDTVPASKLPVAQKDTVKKVSKTDAEWKTQMTPEQFIVMRQKGTEAPFKNKYDKHFEKGLYGCSACNAPLFYSDAKFNSGCGWPAFFEPVSEYAIKYTEDSSHGMKRTEVMCNKCGGHLGHVFEDGPPPTGLRYCINSVSLNFTDSTVKK